MDRDQSAKTSEEPEVGLDERRKFLRSVGLGVAAAAAGVLSGPIVRKLSKVQSSDAWAATPSTADSVRMKADLDRALAKPMDQRRWAMVIDIRKCIGCNACTVACMAENNLPPGVMYRTVADAEDGEYPNLKRFFMPTNCMQCSNPPCSAAANAVIPGSMGVRPDGIVTIDYNKMKGKEVFDAAVKACPYDKSLYYDAGGNHTDGTPAVQPYEKRESVEYGRKLKRADTVGVTRKCHFCVQRIDNGAMPACVTTCIGGAMHFGDLNDSASLVSELAAKKKTTFVMNKDKGTGPRVVYLHDNPTDAETSCAKCHDGGSL